MCCMTDPWLQSQGRRTPTSSLSLRPRCAVLLLVLLPLSYGCETTAGVPRDDSLRVSLDRLYREPSAGNWRASVALSRRDSYSGLAGTVMAINEFEDAMYHRDLRNSMVTTPEQQRRNRQDAIRRLQRELATIKEYLSEDTWRILDSLAKQTNDDHLVWAAGEIEYRLSPQRFGELLRREEIGGAGSASILRELQEQFQAGNGKIDEW